MNRSEPTSRRTFAMVIAAVLVTAVGTASAGAPPPPGGVAVTPLVRVPADYTPDELTLVAGTQLFYVNLDLERHDLAALQDEDGVRRFQSEQISFGQAVPVVGTEALPPGTYSFLCTIHPSMRGVLEVIR